MVAVCEGIASGVTRKEVGQQSAVVGARGTLQFQRQADASGHRANRRRCRPRRRRAGEKSVGEEKLRRGRSGRIGVLFVAEEQEGKSVRVEQEKRCETVASSAE